MKRRGKSDQSLPRSASSVRIKKDRAPYQTRRSASRSWLVATAPKMRGLARELLLRPNASAWLLRGELGSGKTTLVRAALRELGYRGVVASPTFTLSRHYVLTHPRWHRAIHIDAYRIRDQAEEAALEITDAIKDPACLLFIEWPERLYKKYPWSPLRLSLYHRAYGRKVVVL